MSLVGGLGAELLRGTLQVGFLGARGLSLERGLMDLNPDEARIKQEMADACERVVCIADGTKWQRSALLSFVPTAGVHAIVTDMSAPEDQVDAWRKHGVEVVVAEEAEGVRAPTQLVDLRPRPPFDEPEH